MPCCLDATHTMSADSRLRWLGTVTDIVPAPTPPEIARASAIESIKAIHRAGPIYTLKDLIDSPYARGLPKGKTLHAVEHRVDQGGGALAVCCTELFVSRLNNAPAEVASRIRFPAIPRPNGDEYWRRSGRALVDDGFDHRVIRRRVDELVEQLESGNHFSHGPLRPGPHSREGARDIEARNRFELTVQWLSIARLFDIREEIVTLHRGVRVRVSGEYGRSRPRVWVTLLNHTTDRTWREMTDSDGEAVFDDLPVGEYGVRAYNPDGTVYASAPTRPDSHRFMKVHRTPVPGSSPIDRYDEMHAAARAQCRPPSEDEAIGWFSGFFPEFLERDDRRAAVIEVLTRQFSTGRGRYRAAFQAPGRLAEALTAALLDQTPRAVRKSVAHGQRRTKNP